MAQSFTYEPTRDVLYLNNAKSGCSTIKSTMLLGLRQSHDPQNTAALSPKEIHGTSQFWSQDYSKISTQSTFSFTVVRNPFARILSSFLDKMSHVNVLRRQFFWQNGLAFAGEITLTDFLKVLKDNPALYDQHWRPQTANIYAGFVNLDEVHFLESLGGTQASICERLVGVDSFVKRNPHGTQAHTKVADQIDDEAQALIVDLYKDDFEILGYSTDLADVADAPSGVLSIPTQTPVLTEMLPHMHEKHTAVDSFAQSLHGLGIANLEDKVTPKDQNLWHDQVVAATKSGSPAHRYLALSTVTGVARNLFEPDFLTQSMSDIVQLAPYQIGNHINLAKHLAQLGRVEEARSSLTALMDMTWQKDTVATLLRSIDDM